MKKNNSRKPVLLFIIYIIYMLYYLADMNTSANILVKQSGTRRGVHVFLFVLILVLGIYFITRGKYKQNDKFRSRLLLLIIWGIVVDVARNIAFWSVATHIGLLVLFYLIDFFSCTYVDCQDKYKIVIIIELFLWCITIYYGIRAYFNFRNYTGNEYSNVLNLSYNILAFVPILIQIKKKSIRSVSISISALCILISLKRGAIISLISMVIVYFVIIMRTNRSKSIKWKTFFGGSFILLLIIIIVVSLNGRTGGALFNRFSAAELSFGSNRSIIYSRAISEIKSRGILKLVLGTGSGSTEKFIGSGAHNEVLELAISYGIIGVLIYISMFVGGLKQICTMIDCDVESSVIGLYGMSFAYIFVVGIFGSSLFSHMTYHITLVMGLCDGYLSSISHEVNK